MKPRVLAAVSLIAVVLGAASPAFAEDGAQRLSREISRRTDRLLQDVNRQLSERITRELTSPLMHAIEHRAHHAPVARATAGPQRASVLLTR